MFLRRPTLFDVFAQVNHKCPFRYVSLKFVFTNIEIIQMYVKKLIKITNEHNNEHNKWYAQLKYFSFLVWPGIIEFIYGNKTRTVNNSLKTRQLIPSTRGSKKMINVMGTPACTFKQLWDNVAAWNFKMP